MNTTTATYAEVNYLNEGKGIKSWLLTLDHKRIGLMYLFLIMAAFLFGGVLATLIRLELWHPGGDFMDAETYNRIFTLHGAVMIFLFILLLLYYFFRFKSRFLAII